MKKITENELYDMAINECGAKATITAVSYFTKGYRKAEEKHLKEITKLRNLLSQHRVIIDTLYNEEKNG